MKKGNVRNIKTELLSDNWYTLNKITFEYEKEDGSWETQIREAYDRGNGAAILLYNKDKGTVILTRQFRMPTYVNGNEDGMMIEVCAGLLDGDHPEDCIKKEVEEETGYKVDNVQKVFESYMSPGSVTEILHFFIGVYSEDMKISEGGGAEDGPGAKAARDLCPRVQLGQAFVPCSGQGHRRARRRVQVQ